MNMNRNELLFNDKSKSDDKDKNGRNNPESLIEKKINFQRKPAEWYQNVYQKNQNLGEYGEINFNLEKNIKPKYNC